MDLGNYGDSLTDPSTRPVPGISDAQDASDPPPSLDRYGRLVDSGSGLSTEIQLKPFSLALAGEPVGSARNWLLAVAIANSIFLLDLFRLRFQTANTERRMRQIFATIALPDDPLSTPSSGSGSPMISMVVQLAFVAIVLGALAAVFWIMWRRSVPDPSHHLLASARVALILAAGVLAFTVATTPATSAKFVSAIVFGVNVAAAVVLHQTVQTHHDPTG